MPKMYVKQLLEECEVALLLTSGEAGFPECRLITKPIIRRNPQFFAFCLDSGNSVIANIQKSPRGSLFFFHQETFQSILLKGIFTIEPPEQYMEMETLLSAYKQILEIEQPSIVCFETLHIELIPNKNLSAIRIFDPKNM